MKVKVKLLSRVRLLATPWTAAYQAPPPMGFSMQEYWSGLPLPSPNLTSEQNAIFINYSELSLKKKSPPNPDLKCLLRLSITRQKLVRPVLLCLTCSKYKMIEQVSHQMCRMTYSLEYGAI